MPLAVNSCPPPAHLSVDAPNALWPSPRSTWPSLWPRLRESAPPALLRSDTCSASTASLWLPAARAARPTLCPSTPRYVSPFYGPSLVPTASSPLLFSRSGALQHLDPLPTGFSSPVGRRHSSVAAPINNDLPTLPFPFSSLPVNYSHHNVYPPGPSPLALHNFTHISRPRYKTLDHGPI